MKLKFESLLELEMCLRTLDDYGWKNCCETPIDKVIKRYKMEKWNYYDFNKPHKIYGGSTNHASVKPEQFSLSKLEELLTDKEEIILKKKVAVVSADSIVLHGIHNVILTHEEIDKIHAASMRMRESHE